MSYNSVQIRIEAGDKTAILPDAADILSLHTAYIAEPSIYLSLT